MALDVALGDLVNAAGGDTTSIRVALAGHTLTREEERALAHRAEELSIGAGEAQHIRAAAAEAARR